MMCYFIKDEAGNLVATDKDGTPLPTPEAREDRIAAALESIATSLEKIANPVRMIGPDGSVRTLEESLAFRGLRIVRADTPEPAWTFPHEWHVQADRVVMGGLRESGPT